MEQKNDLSQQIVENYNPIIEAAKPLFVLANAMKTNTSSLSIENILNKFSNLIDEFEESAEKKRANYEAIKAAKYCLCTFIDESAAKSGWADDSWSQKSLLVTFFDETWGGERFFEILENAKKDIDRNLYLLEFIYICLQFDYRGKYQIMPNGDISIEKIQKDLFDIINSRRPKTLSILLDKAQSTNQIEERRKKIYIPLWVIAVMASLIIGCIYILLQWPLGNQFNHVSTQVNNLSLPKVIPYKNPTIQEKTIKIIRLRPLLENEIKRKLVEVSDLPDRSIVTILGDGLFESGAETIQDRYFPVLATVGQALNSAQGQIVVTGYTDDTPIRSIKFLSNWHLSQARADAVKGILLNYIQDNDRVRAEGRGSTNPVAPNDSPENKAKNRRVEITLFNTGEGPHLATATEKVISE